MTTDAGAGADTRAQRIAPRLTGALSSRYSFIVLVLVVGITLAIGSVHHALPSEAQRITHLDNIIKCPSCPDLSIAQSNESTAVGLRQKVAEMVHGGASDAAVEAYAVQQYGQTEILQPTGGLTVLEWAVPLAALLAAAAVLAIALVRRSRPGRRASTEDEALVAAALTAVRQKEAGP